MVSKTSANGKSLTSNDKSANKSKPSKTVLRGETRKRVIFGKEDVFNIMSQVEYNPACRAKMAQKAIPTSDICTPLVKFENIAYPFTISITPTVTVDNVAMAVVSKSMRINMSVSKTLIDRLLKVPSIAKKLSDNGWTDDDLKVKVKQCAEDAFRNVATEFQLSAGVPSTVIECSRFKTENAYEELDRLIKAHLEFCNSKLAIAKPKVEEPKVEEPKVEEPKVEEPKALGKAIDFTKTEVLTALAKSKKIKGYKNMNRKELIAALKAKGVTKA